MKMRLVSLSLMLLAVSGCALNDAYLPPLAMLHPNVMFAPHPHLNPAFADLGNVRSEWPTSDAYFARPENLRYREQIYDIQGTSFRNTHFPIRRFQLIREGSAIR